MSTEPGPLLARHDRASARTLLDSLVCVYAEIYAHKADDPFFTVERFTERLLAHSSRDGYELITAWIETALVGYAYGVPLAEDTGWWRGLVDPVPGDLVRETGNRTFALNEIMVRANWRRRGIARQLHDELMLDRPEERATLLVEPRNTPAKSAYAQWGWRRLGSLQPFPDSPVYDAMVLDLRALRSAAS
jgi:GNAT superfamily N-acetyltransferase